LSPSPSTGTLAAEVENGLAANNISTVKKAMMLIRVAST
jgi:hypothetical protein